MEIAVVVVTFNSTNDIRGFVDSALGAGFKQGDILAVDNASTDESVQLAGQLLGASRVLALPANNGYGAAVNRGLRALSAAEAVLVCNPDIRLNARAIGILRRRLETLPDVALIAPLLRNEHGVRKGDGLRFRTPLREVRRIVGDRVSLVASKPPSHSDYADWVLGACMLVRSAAVRQVGGMDESFFMYSEDTEWCYRFWQSGWRVWLCRDAEVTHFGGTSTSATWSDDEIRKRITHSELALHDRLLGPTRSRLLSAAALVRTFTAPRSTAAARTAGVTRAIYARHILGRSVRV